MDAPSRLDLERRYRLLLDISERTRSTLDVSEILDHLLDAVGEAVRYDAAGIFVLRRSGLGAGTGSPLQRIAGIAQRGYDAHMPESDAMLMRGEGIVGHVIRTGECVVAPDAAADPRYIPGRRRTRAEIAVPIPGAGGTVGALNLESDRPGAFGEDDLEVLRFFADAASLVIERAMLHRQILERRQVADQLRLARQVQTRLVPVSPPRVPGWDIAGICLPAFEIGGDYFDHLPLDDGRLALVVADVSGKGVPAALSMTAFRSLLLARVRTTPEPGAVAAALNELLPPATGETAYVTCVYGVLDPASGRFAYTNCGHNPPLGIRADGRIERLDRGGTPLGMLPDARVATGEVVLDPGDLLAFHTDGVVDGENASGEDYGAGRLAALLAGVRHLGAADVIEAIRRATRAFTGSNHHADDFTLLVARRLP